MDYGYQLLRHVFQQVFGNLGAAARITIIPIILAYALCAALLFSIVGPIFMELLQQQPGAAFGEPADLPFGSEAEALTFGGRFFLAFILCIPIFLILYSWAAVGWHRYVLLEEMPNGVAANWSWSMIKGYVWAVVRIALMMMLLGFAASVVIGIVLSAVPSTGLALFLTIGLTIGFTWVLTRLGLILPSAALGQYMKMGESWSATAPVASAILLPIIILPLIFFILNSALGFLGVIGVILTLLVFWVQILANLALLTTLYGNLIEGRQLN
ncbi:hypothetical protein [Gymnodinialimonas ulvae]|uniref:hypothetical protein n=1 Tax=Gymnodinialimonas ulvae TaxID=3126504 RepID=UPI00309A5EB0